MTKRVLDIGQCGFDHASIARMLKASFSAQVTAAEGADDAWTHLHREAFDLVLVNRQLDADGSDGLEIIRQLKSEPELAQIPVMLVTNYPEYQQLAMAAGAEPGFGKRELDKAETRQKLARFLE